MVTESIQPARASWPRAVLIMVLLVFLGWAWSTARSAFTRSTRSRIAAQSQPPATETARPSELSPPERDDLQRAPNPSRLIDALQNQIANSPALQDNDTQASLLDSLQQAGDVLTRTKRQNQQALQQLQRQSRIGESRQAPHLVLVTFDHAYEVTDSETSRLLWFKDLSTRGVSFTQHYTGGTTADAAWCSLMTGKPALQSSRSPTDHQLRETDASIATCLWKAGYDTAFFGAWPGVVQPRRCGFEEWTGLERAHADLALFPSRLTTARSPMTIAANANGQHGVSLWKLLDAEIASFLASHAKATRPWLLHIHLPHLTDTASAETAESVVDHLFESLSSNSLSDSTCVFITALGGRSSAPKLSDAALRVPLLMIGGHPDNVGRQIASVTVAWDLLPTLLDISRAAKRPRELQGQSLMKQDSRTTWDNQRALTWTSNDHPEGFSVRQGEWFATRDRQDGPIRLYQMSADPECKIDVAETHPTVVQRLLTLTEEAAAAKASNGLPSP